MHDGVVRITRFTAGNLEREERAQDYAALVRDARSYLSDGTRPVFDRLAQAVYDATDADPALHGRADVALIDTGATGPPLASDDVSAVAKGSTGAQAVFRLHPPLERTTCAGVRRRQRVVATSGGFPYPLKALPRERWAGDASLYLKCFAM